MARAAQGASPAFFKLIRTGGCASRGQLGAQFSYLFSKSVDVHDSRGLLDGEKRLTPEQIDRAVARWADDWRGQMNAARTTHMVMSFPRETKPRHVSLIAGEICREKLGGRFDYMIAVHTDSPNKNPHAHIIVNRRGEGGDYFTLRQGTEFTYQAFKEAMVDHAARYGIQLEATTRLQRGHVNYPPTDGEWRRAKEKAAASGTAFEAPEGKPRIGSDLARATQEIRDWSLRYRELSSFASAENLQDLATAFEKAAAVLAQGGTIVAKGEPYMAISEDFDHAAAGLRRAVDDAEDRIADAAPNQRPEMERKLAEALTSVEHLQPLGARSRDLRETASEEGIYSAQNLRDVNARFVAEGREKLTLALDGTGIDPVEVEARMRTGANSAALEARWVQQDLQAVADLRGLDLRNEAELRQAISVVDRAYDRVAESYGVDDAIAARAKATGTNAVADYDQRFPRGDTRMADEGSAEQRRDYDRDMAQMGARQLREAAERGEGLPDKRTGAIDGEARDRRDQGAALERMERGHDQGPDTGAQMDRARRDDADAHQSTASIGSTEASRSALREFARPVGDEDERKLREAIERMLTRDELDRLKRGDAEVLRGVGDREDQLTMARDYLRGLDAPGSDQALQRVNEALAAERDHVRQQRGHEGPGHD
ncbi:relaxase/mobilization nuclease domain-containing protein (plasmid) [Paracoccus aestuarii]|nr:relaxase/mobilization nuclease domain-containing protein [Paracoccus aestuarii]WCR01281.1 relaxase/mobilization nuclease domain-containing protein [Paracoccus aestuarii]